MLELLKTVGPKPMPKGGLDAEEEARKVLQVLEQEYGSRKHTRDFFVKQAAYGGETKAGIELNTYPLQLLGPWILTLVPFMFLFFVECVNTKGDTVWRRRPWLGFWAFLSPCIWNMLVLRKCLSAVAVAQSPYSEPQRRDKRTWELSASSPRKRKTPKSLQAKQQHMHISKMW